jgi:hypothetical protein
MKAPPKRVVLYAEKQKDSIDKPLNFHHNKLDFGERRRVYG